MMALMAGIGGIDIVDAKSGRIDMGSPIFDEHSVEHGITGRVGGFSEE